MAETIKTRIQLKNDTEANWKKAINFAPKEGEVIIYSPDDTHPFSRLKIGHNNINVNDLPFIDAHSINNNIFVDTYNDLPPIGNINMKYIVIDTLSVYQWAQGNYTEIYKFNQQQVSVVAQWNPGSMTLLQVNEGILNVDNGTNPTLTTDNINVLISRSS